MSATGPEPNQLVGLKLSPTSRLPARILATNADRVVLVLTLRPNRPSHGLVGSEAAIEYVGERGVYLATGTVESTGPGEETLTVALPAEPLLVQRRAHVRVDAVIPVAIRGGGVGPTWVHAVTLNLSGGGFLVAGPEALRAGDHFDFHLSPGENRERIHGRGRVVRELPAGQRAVEIDDIDRADQELLIRYVFERQRASRWVASSR